jgi:hypothetical protein
MNKLTQEKPAGHFPDLAAFIASHNRLPHLGDVQAPWHYRGWLLPYLILIHELNPKVADRWGYLLRTLEAGKLLDEPIPQVAFVSPDNKVFSLLHDWSRVIGWDCGGWSDFRALLDWLCWGLALSKEEPRLSEEVNEKLYRQVNVQLLLESPHDYLGDYVSAGKSRGWNPTAFFPTPHCVVECMVQMMAADTLQNGRDPRTATICDPCVGSGRMLVHASNFSLNLHGQDIDPLAVAMCKINGALYAPWLSFPLPPSILGTQFDLSPASLQRSDKPPEGVRTFKVHDHTQGLLFEM